MHLKRGKRQEKRGIGQRILPLALWRACHFGAQSEHEALIGLGFYHFCRASAAENR